MSYTTPQTVRVAYQGAPGAFSEHAIRQCFATSVAAVGRDTFEDVGRDVEDGRVEFGMLPMENTLAGGVGASYDVLVTRHLWIVAEVVMPIRHTVVGMGGATIAGLRRVLSHPVALAQCKRFFTSNRHIEAVADYDTAGAAQKVAAAGDPTIAAISAHGAAARYGLVVLSEGVEDRPDNQTRFFLVGPERPAEPPQLRGQRAMPRAAIAAEVANAPGALASILLPIAQAGINLSRIEGRPGLEPWSYHFVLEMDAPDEYETIGKVVDRMAGVGNVRVLGMFPRVTAGVEARVASD